MTQRRNQARGERDGNRPRFLVFAYACEPDRGGESEAGWLWSRMLARLGETWVITRANNRDVIGARIGDVPERENLRFVYVDLPNWARFWKRRNKRARLYYLLWQATALSQGLTLQRRVHFDAVWHLTWANAWIGSLAAMLRGPLIYGPVGGGVGMRWKLVSVLGIRGTLYEVARSLARSASRYANPLARFAWYRAELILVQNRETLSWLPRRHRGKTIICSNVVLDRVPTPDPRRPRMARPTALYAGRLVPLKGLALALRALTYLPEWHLTVCGHGPDERRLKRLARRLDVESRVEFLGWKSRVEVLSMMHMADVFIFPSLHDEGGFVVAEALAAGLPVVCVDRGGPPLIGGEPVRASTAERTARDLAHAVARVSGTKPRPFPSVSSHTRRLRTLLKERVPGLQGLGGVGSRPRTRDDMGAE